MFFAGSSGDEMDSTQELQNNSEVPNGLEVIPLNMQDHYLDRIKVSRKKSLNLRKTKHRTIQKIVALH